MAEKWEPQIQIGPKPLFFGIAEKWEPLFADRAQTVVLWHGRKVGAADSDRAQTVDLWHGRKVRAEARVKRQHPAAETTAEFNSKSLHGVTRRHCDSLLRREDKGSGFSPLS